MKRGLLTRRIAAVILVSFATLMIAVFAPLIYGLRIEDAARLGTGVFASQADTVLISRPIRLSSAPDIVLHSATMVAAPAAAGRGRAVKLIAPVFTVILGASTSDAAAATPPQNAAEALQLLAPLAEQFASASIDSVAVQGGTLEIKWGAEQTLTLSGIDAHINSRGRANLAAKGQFDYRGQSVTFDLASAPMLPPLAIGPDLVALAGPSSAPNRAPLWPLRLSLASALLDVTFDGVADLGRSPKLSGTGLLSTPDVTKTARWLGHGWRGRAGGPALRINGPVHWSEGAATFGKSVVSLSDQTGAGAITISFRNARPLIEASLAFPALDAAPFMTPEPIAIVPAVLLKMVGTAAPSSTMAWRSLPTSFPAITSVDLDWRISAERLQWQGEPVGSAAVSVAANDGKMSVDFAELDVGPHRGTLQISSDGQTTNPSVTVRGQFRSADAGQLLTEFFGGGVVTSNVTSNFEITGLGATLGDIVQTAKGHGTFNSADGTLPVDFGALQAMARSAAKETPGNAWNSIRGRSPYNGLVAKWQMRDGFFVFDHAQVESSGLLATLQGQVGTATNELDLIVRVTPATADGATRAGSPRSRSPLSRSLGTIRDTVAIHGSKDQPIFSPLDIDRAP